VANRPLPIPLAVGLFLVTRAVAFLVVTTGDAVGHYRHYDDALRGQSVRQLYESDTERVEYPPLSIPVMTAVGRLADALPESALNLLRFRATPPAGVAEGRYQLAFALVAVTFDATLFAAVWFVARSLSPREAFGERLAIYAVVGALFAPILYDRLDLFVGAFALVAVAASGKGRPNVAYVALAVGTAFKLVPVLLLPVACFAAAVMAVEPSNGSWKPLVIRTGRHALVAGLILAVYPILSFALLGPKSFDFLSYHSTRGLEVESVYAWPVLLIEPSTRIVDDFHSHTLHGPLAASVARLVPLVSVFVLLVSYAVAARAMLRVKDQSEWLPTLAGSCVLVWLAFVLTNKVGSPQYGLWFLTLVPLLPRQGRVATAFIAMALMFTVVYPGLYHHVTGGTIGGEPLEFAGPTRLGFALLILRSTGLVLMTAAVGRILWIGPRPSGTVA
jgi:hypothetical protein